MQKVVESTKKRKYSLPPLDNQNTTKRCTKTSSARHKPGLTRAFIRNFWVHSQKSATLYIPETSIEATVGGTCSGPEETGHILYANDVKLYVPQGKEVLQEGQKVVVTPSMETHAKKVGYSSCPDAYGLNGAEIHSQ